MLDRKLLDAMPDYAKSDYAQEEGETEVAAFYRMRADGRSAWDQATIGEDKTPKGVLHPTCVPGWSVCVPPRGTTIYISGPEVGQEDYRHILYGEWYRVPHPGGGAKKVSKADMLVIKTIIDSLAH